MERNIQYLRELTVLRMVYNVDLNNYQLSSNSGSIWCMQTVWWKSVQSSPLLNANSLAVMTWKDRDEQTGNELVTNSDNTKKISLLSNGSAFQLWIRCPRRFCNSYGIYLSPHLHIPASQLAEASIFQFSWEDTVGTHQVPPHSFTLWTWRRYEVGRKILEAWEHELQGRTTVKGDSSRKMATPVFSEQSPRHRWWTDLISELGNKLFGLHPHKVSNEYND